MLNHILLSIAKTAILSKFSNDIKFNKKKLFEDYIYLNNDGAVFVTLHQNKNLRGCIGSLVAHRKLFDDIVHNAISAAFHDPRFPELCEDELKNLELEVSLLSPSTELKYENFEDLKQKIKPFEDGLILKHGGYQGTFLPQVWEQLPTTELFLEYLAQKAGTTVDIYNQHPKIYRYSVEKVTKAFSEILPL